MTDALSANDALARLRQGNLRFVSHSARSDLPKLFGTRRAGTRGPFAAVLGCSDARVPPEVVFDQGIGDLFVVRVAGNVVSLPRLEA